MPPRPASPDRVNQRCRNAVKAGERRRRHVTRGDNADRVGLRNLPRRVSFTTPDPGITAEPMRVTARCAFGMLPQAVTITGCASSFRHHIVGVICLISKKQVRRVTARRVIAAVKNAKVAGIAVWISRQFGSEWIAMLGDEGPGPLGYGHGVWGRALVNAYGFAPTNLSTSLSHVLRFATPGQARAAVARALRDGRTYNSIQPIR